MRLIDHLGTSYSDLKVKDSSTSVGARARPKLGSGSIKINFLPILFLVELPDKTSERVAVFKRTFYKKCTRD